MSEKTIPPELQAIFSPSGLSPSYRDEDAVQLFKDGLGGENLQVKVVLGCAGSYMLSFSHQGQLFVALGDCDACPSCAKGDEITDPAGELQRWLRGAHLFRASSLDDARSQIRASGNEQLIFDLRCMEEEAGN